jgi:hypothetical protein
MCPEHEQQIAQRLCSLDGWLNNKQGLGSFWRGSAIKDAGSGLAIEFLSRLAFKQRPAEPAQ